MKQEILIFGKGYVSEFMSQKLSQEGWSVYCTSRKISSYDHDKKIKLINFFDPNLPDILKSVSCVLSTVPTDHATVDPVLDRYSEIIAQSSFQWVGYLSSTGVYGDHQGAWVNEETLCTPTHVTSELRLLAEKKWLALYDTHQIPVHVLRLSGIYGPGNNCLEDINQGKDFTIIKKDQFFSRIHVSDIVGAVKASMDSPTPGEIYNVTDDEPAPVNVVHQFGAKILKKEPLKEIDFEEAYLSSQARFFFKDNKKVSNQKITQKLAIQWQYPSYREGLLEGCLPYLKDGV